MTQMLPASKLTSYLYLGYVEKVGGYVWIFKPSRRWHVYVRTRTERVTKKIASFDSLKDLLRFLREELNLDKLTIERIKAYYEGVMIMRNIEARLRDADTNIAKTELTTVERMSELKEYVSRLLDLVKVMAEMRFFLMRFYEVFADLIRNHRYVLEQLPVLRDVWHMYSHHVVRNVRERLESDELLMSIKAKPAMPREQKISYCMYLAKMDEVAAKVAEMLGLGYERVYEQRNV